MATLVKMLVKKGQEGSSRLRLGDKVLAGANVGKIPQ